MNAGWDASVNIDNYFVLCFRFTHGCNPFFVKKQTSSLILSFQLTSMNEIVTNQTEAFDSHCYEC